MGDLEEDLHLKQCRYCMECDNQDTMISPCNCNGSLKWVHRGCHQRWITESGMVETCPTCRGEYHLDAKYAPPHPMSKILLPLSLLLTFIAVDSLILKFANKELHAELLFYTGCLFLILSRAI
jgi:E3 ubiquitin-protein ligase DOA10